MRNFALCVFIMCCLLPVCAFATDLPANPWLNNNTDHSISPNQPSAETASDGNRSSELINNINIQFQNSENQALQVINEALPEQQRRPSAQTQKYLPSWKELIPQANSKDMLSASSAKTKAPRRRSSNNSAVNNVNKEVSRTMSDIKAQYRNAKRTTNSYINKAKRRVNQLENEAQSSVNQLQRMLK